jgi:glycosyltransferase involved in cell wall biosynthesis
MKITVGIPATRAQTLEFAARSICEQTWKDWELLIVGQGSEAHAHVRALQAAGERLERWDSRIKYTHLAEMGVSRARNEVFSRAQGEVIAFVDDDCEADPEWLAVIAARLQSNPSVGLVGGATVPPSETRSGLRLRLSTCPTILPAESLYDPAASRVPPPGWDWGSANVAIRAEVVARAGLFDEHLGPGTPLLSGEDRDYKFRLEAAGVSMMATPRAIVRHTYGRRYGLRAVTGMSRTYARGGGAVAGKLTVAGDPRGAAWVRAAQQEFWRDLVKPGRSAAAIYRMPHFLRAYREVVAGYTIDPATGWLRPRPESRVFSDQPLQVGS